MTYEFSAAARRILTELVEHHQTGHKDYPLDGRRYMPAARLQRRGLLTIGTLDDKFPVRWTANVTEKGLNYYEELVK